MQTNSTPATNRAAFLAALTVAYADLFANNTDYAYSASKTTPAILAERMTASAVSGSISMNGDGVKRACIACGIPHTLRAVLAFVGCESSPRIAAKKRAPKVEVIVLPNIAAMMSGVARIERAHELVVLKYTDGKSEAAKILPARWEEIRGESFRIISEVQSKRVSA